VNRGSRGGANKGAALMPINGRFLGVGLQERLLGSLAQQARAYGQSRGVIPFSCAYFAADASTRGRTSA
jgi:hypothetical protein